MRSRSIHIRVLFCLFVHQVRRVFDVLLRCTEDYATDKRGDVGSWVRQAALRGLRDMTKLAVLASTLAPTLRPVSPLGVGDKVSPAPTVHNLLEDTKKCSVPPLGRSGLNVSRASGGAL